MTRYQSHLKALAIPLAFSWLFLGAAAKASMLTTERSIAETKSLLNVRSSSIGGDLVAQACGNIEVRPNNSNLEYRRGQGWNTCSGYRFLFQGDGNLVLYSPSGTPLWATGTQGTDVDLLAVQSDGNVVLYDHGNPVWATDTCCRSGAFLAIQADGNVVVYESNGTPIFATNTFGGRVSTLSAATEWSDRNAGTTASNAGTTAPKPSLPIHINKQQTVGSHWYMETNATVSKNGRIDATTKTKSCQHRGFTGGVWIALLDKDGNVLYVTDVKRYGVNGKLPFGGCEDRTEQWNETVPPEIVDQVSAAVVQHAHSPKVRVTKEDVFEAIRLGAEIYKGSQEGQ